MNGPTELDLAGVMEKLRDRENPPEGMNPSTRPVVVVEGVEVDPVVMEGDIAEGYWAGIPPQLSVTNWGTPSGPSSDSCSSSRSPSLLSMYSDGSWNDGYTTQAPNDSAPARVIEQSRCRHASTSISHPADPCENNLANARFCASQDNLGPQADYTKRKHSLKNMFLDVFHLESSHRKRSASSAEGRHRAHSSGDSPVKKLISRIRSRSYSDLLSRSSSSGSVDLEQEKEVNLNPEVRDGEVLGVDSLPATAINTRLVGRFRKNNANQKKRRWSLFDQHIMKSQDSPPDEASEYNVPLKYENEREGQGRWVVTLEMPGESKTDKGEAPPEVFKDSSDASHQKPRLVRTRSNSESTILVVEKKRKKRKDSRMIDRLLDFRLKKSLLRGSLPTLLGDKVSSQPADTKIPSKLLEDNENVFTDNLPVPGDVPSTFKTPRTQSMQNLTDYAVDDYFSPEIDRRYSTDDMDSYRESDRNKENLPHYLTVDQSRNRRHRFSIDNLWNALKGKSRSVDHTIHNPFDLDALRRKIGERTTSEPSRDISSPSPEPVDASKENISPSEKKMDGRPPPILPTMTYTVSANDTLTSIAARFDTTPSELSKLNKLSTRFVYPGQVIAVPDKSALLDNKADGGLQDATESNGQDPLAQIRPPSPIQRGDLKTPVSPHTCPRTPANSVDIEKSLDRECLEKFLKISVRHITDGQGVVAGVLLVTPNAVMFDPNVSDPLVIEHGPESYGVIAPMEFVVNAALYYDIAHMRVKDTNLPKPEIPKPEIYWGPSHVERTGSQESPGKDASLSKDATFPELAASQDDNDSSCSCGGDTRESSAFPKAFEHELLTPIGSDVSPASGDGQPSSGQPSPSGLQQQTGPVAGDLTPIAEASRLEDSHATPPSLAQTQCDNTAAQDLAQTDWTAATTQMEDESMCNDKKRTTSVTFDLTGEGEEAIPDIGSEASIQESRKQKVFKRLSYPLSWMESFNTDKDSMAQNQAAHPSSAPPVSTVGGNVGPEGPDGNKAGMFSNVFSMSNVSSMLSSSPKYLVDFSSGLFARSPSDSTSSVRDVTELGTPPGSLEGYRVAHSVFYRKQSSLGNDKEERKGIPIFHPGRPSMDFARRPTNQQPLLVSTQQTPPLASGIPTHAVNQQSSQQQQILANTLGLITTENQQAQKRAQYKEGPKFGLKSMVSMDDMPELFASFDKLIPKPATSCEDPPLYLCLRMGKPAGKRIPKSTPVMSYGKKRMRPEYWFSIPRNRSDELFNFFQLWAHDIYGELNEDEVATKGFVLVEEDTELWADEEHEGENEDRLGGELTEMTKESWEVVSMSEELRRALYSSGSLTSLDLEAFLPEIVGTSEIITDIVRKNMYKKLPARAQGYSWKLVFSTSQNGFSLNSLYRKMSDVETPVMLFIQDTHQNVFGAVVSGSLHVSELYYGTGESFLFSFHPEFQVFPWTGENTFFVRGNNESLIVGGGDGNFGLWLDGDLYQGRTQPCKTYNNPQLTDSEDFIIKSVECWCFE